MELKDLKMMFKSVNKD